MPINKYSNSTMIPQEYKQIIDSTAIVSKTDEKGIITYVNDMFCKSSGYKREELIGKSHRLVRHPDTPKSLFANMWSTIKTNKTPWYGIIKNKKKDGSDYVVEARIHPQLNKDGEITGYIGIRYDITELEHQKELNKTIMDAQEQVVIVGDKENGIVSVNEAFYQVFGFKSLDYFKKQNACIINFINNIDEMPQEKLNDLVEKNDCELYRVKIITSSSEQKVFQLKIKNIDNGLKHYYIITLNDVTYMQNKIDDAKREVYAKSNFLATMSHEIRTPLNGVLPFLELLHETNLTAEQKDYVETISKSSHHLLGIINDILDFSKIESGNLKIEEIDFNPVDEFESMTELYIAKANEKNVDFCVFIDPNMPLKVKGDPLRIKQILANFITNAIKFTDGEGEVFVSIEYWGQIDSQTLLKFSVKDTGIGIAKEKLETIFDPFSQADNTITRKFGGTGLGLSISQNLAKLMGAEIKIESTIGEGSEFSFVLGLQTEGLIFRDKKFNKDYRDFKVAILVADSNYSRCAKILEKYFEAFGFDYTYVKNKSDIENNKIDVLFIASSGSDNIEWLQSHRPIGKTKIVAVLPSRAENSNKFYCDGSIYMPVNGSKIFDAILDSKALDSAIEKEVQIVIPSKTNIDTNNMASKRVLVAEDNTTNQKLAIAMLKKFGIAPDIANNGIEALAMAQNINYDLIFMDIHMPQMNGIESTKEILKYFESNMLKPSPIIALTADAIKGQEQIYRNAGMSDFISKPIDKQHFADIVNKYLSSNASSVPTPDDFDNIESTNTKTTAKQRIVGELINALELDLETAEVLFDDFMNSWKTYETLLQVAIEEQNFEQIRSIAHALKGASGSIRMHSSYAFAKELEDNAKEANSHFDYSKGLEILKNSIEN